MNRILTACAAAAVILTAVSCTKEGPSRFKGNYTFKTSGTITVRPEGDDQAGTTVFTLSDENGQMDVVARDKSSGDMVVAMNILGGSVLTFDAVADGMRMNITPFTRQLTVPVIEEGVFEVVPPVASVTVTGYAERYADALLFRLEYEGSYTFRDVKYEIVRSDISCWAKEN